MKNWQVCVLAAFVIIVALCIVGKMDEQDEQAEAQHYCAMVKQGYWPDYKGTYKKYCK